MLRLIIITMATLSLATVEKVPYSLIFLYSLILFKTASTARPTNNLHSSLGSNKATLKHLQWSRPTSTELADRPYFHGDRTAHTGSRSIPQFQPCPWNTGSIRENCQRDFSLAEPRKERGQEGRDF